MASLSTRQTLCDESITVRRGNGRKATFTAQALIHAPFLPLRSLYCSPDTFCLFTPTLWPNLAGMREIKSGLVKSLHFPALVSSIKLSLSAGRLRDAAKNKCNARRARRKARGHGRKLRRARRAVGKKKKVGYAALNEKSLRWNVQRDGSRRFNVGKRGRVRCLGRRQERQRCLKVNREVRQQTISAIMMLIR